MTGYKMTRKEFEKKVTYVADYRVYNVVDGFYVDKYAEKCDRGDYEINTRSDALKALRQFIWSEHKWNGHTHNMDDFTMESMGGYEEVE